MKLCTLLFACAATVLFTSCAVSVNDPDREFENEETTKKPGTVKPPERFTFKTAALFPFKNTSNWWRYSEPGGNTLAIEVTDTISDDGITFYRVSFMENRVDTTDDWFQQTSQGILFGASLTGTYAQFLPTRLESPQDTFSSRNSTVSWKYYETTTIDTLTVPDAVALKYTYPVIHGFDEIVLADSLGIVRLIDYDGRWTVDYELDSCSVDGKVRSF